MRLPEYVETPSTSFPTTFTWNYAHEDAQLVRLYGNAEHDQWDGSLRRELPDLGILQDEALEPSDVAPLAAEPERGVLQ